MEATIVNGIIKIKTRAIELKIEEEAETEIISAAKDKRMLVETETMGCMLYIKCKSFIFIMFSYSIFG